MSISAYNIGTKFNADGSVRFFPGNTVISKMNHGASVYEEFKKIRAILEKKPASRCVTMLPDDSLHMTVFEGVCHQWRKPESWTSLLPIDCPLSQVDDLFEQAFQMVQPLGQVEMRMAQIKQASGITIGLEPVTQAGQMELKRYRDDMSKAFGIRFPNHDNYRYHISICYFTKDATLEEEAQLAQFHQEAQAYIDSKDICLTLAQPILTYFDNMFCFNSHRIPRNGL